jgi:predicted HAD superfamily Cof-like phosphohydrolase
MQMMKRIIEMHKKFELDAEQVPHHLTDDEKNFRIVALQEELDEFQEAATLEEEFDALLDLMVFTLGTIHRMGLADVFEAGFNRVMDCNMQKYLAGEAHRSKRGFARDLCKPEGWIAPNLKDLVNE